MPSYVTGRSCGRPARRATSLDGAPQNNFQRNARYGTTAGWAIARGHSVKGSFSSGVYTRFGGNFRVFALGYQYSWGG